MTVNSFLKQYVWITSLSAALLLIGNAWRPSNSQIAIQLEQRDKVMEMFHHAYTAYMTNAFPADELMPIACKGRIRGITPSRGDVDDVLGNFSLTLVDTLDTLGVLGLYDEFEDAVKKVEKTVTFQTDVMVSVFETIIRMLGGLLGGHSVALELQEEHGRMMWYNNSLLKLATNLGNKLLPAFNTTTGIPFSRINLLTGAVRKAKDKDTCTACAGTMLLEMAALTRYTGDSVYESCARRAMDYLWSRRQRSTDLMGTVLNVENGEWIRRESGVGAGIDSYYEYLLKGYIFLGDETYLERFNAHYMAIKQYMNQSPLLVDVLMHKPTTSARHFVDALSAFWPGLQVLKGDVQTAIRTHELLYQVFTRHTFLPEAFTTSFDIHWGQYPLRPEFAESTYLLYKATGDPYYIEVGKTIVENLEKRARVKCGFAGIKDVRTFTHEDRMDSYFLAEMFKYLYLLFTPENNKVGIAIDKYILTTEAHVLPLKLSLQKSFFNNVSFPEINSPANAEDNFERSCVNSVYVKSGSLTLTKKLRREVNIADKDLIKQQPKCTTPDSNLVKTWYGPRQLQANEFVPGNKKHMDILEKMGISIVMLPDGKVQLIQQLNSAHSKTDASEGAVFMQEMIDMARTSGSETQPKPVYVKVSGTFDKQPFILKGGPAQFGPQLDDSNEVFGTLAFSVPYDACSALENPDQINGKIVLVVRGQCMFINKVANVEKAGGTGVIILDNTSGTSYDNSAPFAMAGDEKTETNIPAVFLFHKEGALIEKSLPKSKLNNISVILTSQFKPSETQQHSEVSLENQKKSRTNKEVETCKSHTATEKKSLTDDGDLAQQPKNEKTSTDSENPETLNDEL
uniref:alpha-1,2-Mannosidase n=1 Tax=Phallusia mammillata TaxID=59560 RepID=A0A6F9DB04_9ASCI|nr:ER degradation-enhancing alpha-mannosidase-like protein 3 [Phallusia mammillata]